MAIIEPLFTLKIPVACPAKRDGWPDIQDVKENDMCLWMPP